MDQICNTRRVLVVDDNRDAADTTAFLLEAHGFRTEVVYDGEQALAAAVGFKPDVIFLDITMPRMDGYEALAKLRRLKDGASARIVALTALSDAASLAAMAAAGFDAHLTKPASVPSLLLMAAH
jgi:CheY-like chemotaxis protein